MPTSKRKKRKKSKKANQANNRKSSDMVFVKHPFSNIPRDILLKGLAEVGEKKSKEFPSILLKTEQILCKLDPLLTISMLTTYGLIGSVNKNGEISKGYKGDKFNQSHVELIQALTLKINPLKISFAPPHPSQIQDLFDLSEELAESYHLRRLNELGRDLTDEDGAVKLIQEELRLHTQIVRNWGYLSKVISITKSLCKPVDDIFAQRIGLSATELIDFFLLLNPSR